MTFAGPKHLSTTQRYIEVNDQMMREAVEAYEANLPFLLLYSYEIS